MLIATIALRLGSVKSLAFYGQIKYAPYKIIPTAQPGNYSGMERFVIFDLYLKKATSLDKAAHHHSKPH